MTAPVRRTLALAALVVGALSSSACETCEEPIKARIVVSECNRTIVEFPDGTRYERVGNWGAPGDELTACKCTVSTGVRWWR